MTSRNKAVEAALRGLVQAVGNHKVPQTAGDVAIQVLFTLGPALEAGRIALANLDAASAAEGGEAVAWTSQDGLEYLKKGYGIDVSCEPKSMGRNIPLYTSPSPQRELEERCKDAEALIALIREEASKSNAPLGRSDHLALTRILAALLTALSQLDGGDR